MPKIDLGNFGQSTITPAPQPNTAVVGQAVEQLGGTIGAVAEQAAQQRFQQQAAIASNNLLDHQLKSENIVRNVGDKLATGELTPEQAPAEYQRQAADNVLPRVDHLEPAAAEAYTRGAQRVAAEGGLKVEDFADLARKQRYSDQFGQAVDSSRKLAGQPGTDPKQVQQIVDQLQTWRQVGLAAKVPPAAIDKAIQDATDGMWFDNAVQRSIESHDNMAGLQNLQHDLTDKGGLYDGKLDSNKRAAVMMQVEHRMDAIHMRLEHEADKRDADGARAINEITLQTSSGVPAPASQWTQWAQRTQGTSSASAFTDAMKGEAQVQDLLRQPIDKQMAYLRTEQARQDTQGATIKEQTDLYRLGNSVKRNITTMQQDPLVFLQQRTGKETPPLDMTQLADPNGAVALKAQFDQRALDLTTMQAKYGPVIKTRPLLPEDVSTLGAIVEAGSPKDVAGLFKTLRSLSPNDHFYSGMIAQLAPDHPVLALAGERAIQDPLVSQYIIQGEAKLNPSKAAKQADGKPAVSLFEPTDAVFQQAFTNAVGAAFIYRPAAAETAYQAVKAYYVGKSSASGNMLEKPSQPDSKLIDEAITAVVGQVVNYNGKGEVTVPWGMDKSTFEQRVDNAVALAATRYKAVADLSPAQRSQLALQGTEQEGVYVIPYGSDWLGVSDGHGGKVPIVLDLNDPASIHPPAPMPPNMIDPRTGHSATYGR